MLPNIIMPAERRSMMFAVAVAVVVASYIVQYSIMKVFVWVVVCGRKKILKIKKKLARSVCDLLMGLN